jgi:ribonucleotide monophosphatase NagD (HAD superfamily)
MTSEDVKFAISVGLPSLLVLVGILVNNSRLSDLRHLMDKRFDSVDKRFDDVTRIIEARFQA